MAEANVPIARKPRRSLFASLGRAAVRGLDRALRRLEGVEEFCQREDCFFRIALVRARAAVHLEDGTHIARGDPIGEIHYWNEHVPRLEAGRSVLARSLAIDRAVRRSLQALAEFIESDPRYREVQAFGGVMGGLPLHGATRMAVAVRRYGFETRPIAPPHGLAHRLHRWGEDMLVRMLVWTFNPGSLHAAPARCEIWMSRKTLLSRYGPANP